MCIRDRLTSESNEVSFTDNNVAAQSTPTTRVKELSMDDIFTLMKTMSENLSSDINKMNSSINVKLDVQKNEIQEIKSSVNEKLDEQNNRFNEQNIKFDIQNSSFNAKLDELKIDINEVKIKCESNFNELKYELNKTLSHSLKSMNNRIEVESSMTEKIDKQIQEVTGNFECKTNENYNDMCKNVVENKEINVESDKDDFVEVEFSNEVLLTNVNQLEREYEESIQLSLIHI